MITILVENKAAQGLATEHGLAMWIETEGRRILFDTGQGAALEPNARMLGTDLSTADTLVLSHGHYDHTGALASVLRQAPDVDVYCHPGVTRPRYAIRDGKTRSIGIPREPKEALDAVPEEHLHWVEKPLMLTDKVGLTGFVPRQTGYEDTGGPFYLDPEGTSPDLIEDDMALWIDTDEGTVVCLGCAHAGVVNTLEYISGLTGHRTFRAVIGGFHLMSAGQERLDETVEALGRLSAALLAPCHCTGDSATAHLRAALGERVAPSRAGTVYRF